MFMRLSVSKPGRARANPGPGRENGNAPSRGVSRAPRAAKAESYKVACQPVACATFARRQGF